MIKFRAWNKVDKFMTVPLDIKLGSDGYIYWIEAMGLNGEHDEGDLDVFKLEQLTGLTDVNGNEIYENDLVRLTDDLEDPIYKVIFDEAKFEIIGGGVCYDLGEEFMDCEVIGNVHENPDLLEADK